jgi:hypothetical protein
VSITYYFTIYADAQFSDTKSEHPFSNHTKPALRTWLGLAPPSTRDTWQALLLFVSMTTWLLNENETQQMSQGWMPYFQDALKIAYPCAIVNVRPMHVAKVVDM